VAQACETATMTSTDLALLPEPDAAPLPVVLAQCRRIWIRRSAIRLTTDQLAEAIRRAQAVEAYLRRRTGHDDAIRATRALEAAVGEALGKAEHGGKPGIQGRTSLMREVQAIPKNDRQRFRLLAQHRRAWEAECEKRPLSRREALRLVKAAVMKVKTSDLLGGPRGLAFGHGDQCSGCLGFVTAHLPLLP
jgi:hypothetical protein